MTVKKNLKAFGFEPDKAVATMTIEQLYKLIQVAIRHSPF